MRYAGIAMAKYLESHEEDRRRRKKPARIICDTKGVESGVRDKGPHEKDQVDDNGGDPTNKCINRFLTGTILLHARGVWNKRCVA
jgi:hypothetical protein